MRRIGESLVNYGGICESNNSDLEIYTYEDIYYEVLESSWSWALLAYEEPSMWIVNIFYQAFMMFIGHNLTENQLEVVSFISMSLEMNARH